MSTFHSLTPAPNIITAENPYSESDVETPEDEDVVVVLPDEEQQEVEEKEKSGFYDNLAEKWSPTYLNQIAVDLLSDIEKDKDARKLRDKQYEEGIKRTGMGEEAPGGADFEGANKVTHPIITRIAIDFEARAIKELFPPNGPVKLSIVGDVTRGRLERAERKRRHMNVQLTRDIPEYRSELEQTLSQLSLGGAQYMKWYWDKRLKRPRCEFVPIDDIFIPYSASNAYTATRLTHRQYLTELEFNKRVRTGMYADPEVEATESLDEMGESKSAKASHKIEGKEKRENNIDGLREVYEIYTWLEAEEEDDLANFEYGACPYIVTIDKDSEKVIGLYRNWDIADDTQAKLDWIVEYIFIPWRGAQGAGLPHIMGGLSAAATGALRALLDSAHINNAPTMLKLKGARIGGQSQNISVTQVTEIDGGVGVDDIRKVAMPLPFNPPSQVLFELLGLVTDLGNQMVQTVLDESTQATSEVPVGTQLSRVEQGMMVFSAIHSRLHASQTKSLEILHRLNRQYLDDQEVIDEYGEVLARKEDYEGPMDVMPVSDPHIFSEAQRFAQSQGIVQMMTMAPQLYDQYAVHRRVLEGLKVPAVDEILPPPKQPIAQNAVAENVQMMMGQPATAFPDQDHLAHIEVLLRCVEDPNYGGSALIAPAFLPNAMEHLKQHLAFWYGTEMMKLVNHASGIEIADVEYTTDELGQKYDEVLANAAQVFTGISAKTLAAIPPVIQQAMQVMQQFQSGGQDPNMIVAQATMMDAQTRAKKAQDEAQDKQQRNALQAKTTNDNAALKAKEIDGKHQMNFEDNQTDLQIAAMKESGKAAEAPEAPKAPSDKGELGSSPREWMLTSHAMMDTVQQTSASLADAIVRQGETLAQSIAQQGEMISQKLADINIATAEEVAATIENNNRAVLTALTAPRRVITDEKGRIVGSEIVASGPHDNISQ